MAAHRSASRPDSQTAYQVGHSSDIDGLRTEIAVTAARMIAEDGADYGTAKRKAAKQILGDAKPVSDVLPDNAQIEDEVRVYNELFLSDVQPARLLHLRIVATALMEQLLQFSPYLTGAVLNGTAGEHSDIHLQLFADSAKDVEIYLLNKNVSFEVSETPHAGERHKRVETLSFMWRNEGAHLSIYDAGDLRKLPKSSLERADLDAVCKLIAAADPIS